MTEFSFDYLIKGMEEGKVKEGSKMLWDTAHSGKQEHIDLSINNGSGFQKYSNLSLDYSEMSKLKDNFPNLKSGTWYDLT